MAPRANAFRISRSSVPWRRSPGFSRFSFMEGPFLLPIRRLGEEIVSRSLWVWRDFFGFEPRSEWERFCCESLLATCGKRYRIYIVLMQSEPSSPLRLALVGMSGAGK